MTEITGVRMASGALRSWQGPRLVRIDELLAAHETVRLPGPGRKWNTQQLNRALVLTLAAEFQGYTRDLHDLAIDFFVGSIAAGNPALGTVVRSRLTENRQLDRGNAQPGSLGSDFARFGLQLKAAMIAADPRTEDAFERLDALNEARNAAAHAHEAKLAAVRAAGFPLTLKTIKRWRSTLDLLARTMDSVTSAHLAHLFGAQQPW